MKRLMAISITNINQHVRSMSMHHTWRIIKVF